MAAANSTNAVSPAGPGGQARRATSAVRSFTQPPIQTAIRQDSPVTSVLAPSRNARSGRRTRAQNMPHYDICPADAREAFPLDDCRIDVEPAVQKMRGHRVEGQPVVDGAEQIEPPVRHDQRVVRPDATSQNKPYHGFVLAQPRHETGRTQAGWSARTLTLRPDSGAYAHTRFGGPAFPLRLHRAGLSDRFICGPISDHDHLCGQRRRADEPYYGTKRSLEQGERIACQASVEMSVEMPSAAVPDQLRSWDIPKLKRPTIGASSGTGIIGAARP